MSLSHLLEILVCPESGRSLDMADEVLLGRVNDAVLRGEVRTRGGELLRERLEGGLVRTGGDLLYPIRSGIPIMLHHEAIPLDAPSPGS